MAFTFKFFTEVLFLSIILCLANTGIVNVLVSTLYSKPDEVTGYECGLYSTKGGRLKDRISFYTVGLTMMIFDVEVVLTFAFLLSLTFATTSSFLSVGIFVVILGLDLFLGNVIKWIRGRLHVFIPLDSKFMTYRYPYR